MNFNSAGEQRRESKFVKAKKKKQNKMKMKTKMN